MSRWKQILLPPFFVASTAGQMPMDRGMQEVGGSVEDLLTTIYVYLHSMARYQSALYFTGQNLRLV
ncbi:hypothetical protein DWY62_20140 [Bacteroides sp. AF26-10BH]|nr:hypothetical protein DWY62_20140 [Bacteroides sp. AF26-10BH]RJV47207.1 hypothetical protein DWX15_20320 [Bacteroides sp. AF18-33]